MDTPRSGPSEPVDPVEQQTRENEGRRMEDRKEKRQMTDGSAQSEWD